MVMQKKKKKLIKYICGYKIRNNTVAKQKVERNVFLLIMPRGFRRGGAEGWACGSGDGQ